MYHNIICCELFFTHIAAIHLLMFPYRIALIPINMETFLRNGIRPLTKNPGQKTLILVNALLIRCPVFLH